jgi:sorbitol-specific phosphotransferase system component IIA
MISSLAQAYAYELRRGGVILSTGLLTAEQELAPGDEITLAGVVARVEEVGWANGEPRLMLQPVEM